MLFFFQAEDGIRDGHVTGVQTCALPISTIDMSRAARASLTLATRLSKVGAPKKAAGSSSTKKATVPLRPVRSWRAVGLATYPVFSIAVRTASAEDSETQWQIGRAHV